jgi:nucleoside-diphosphate-sugar epimerase
VTKTLVTGGSGYLGRHLVAALVAQGRDVRVLARPASDVTGLEGVEIVRGDLTSREDLTAAMTGVERVFNVAAETRDDQPLASYRAVNVDAVESLLELAPALGVKRVVHTSSYFAIGRTGLPRRPADHVADEYWTHDPSDMHGPREESKYDAEHALNQRVSISEPVLALIPTMIYGPELAPVRSIADLRPGNRIVAMLAEHAAGTYPGIPGDGQQIWNLVHVEDVVAGHLVAMDAGDDSNAWPPPDWTHWHYILGGENVTLSDLFARFGRLTGCSVPKALGQGSLFKKLFGGGTGFSKERFAMDGHSWAYSSAMAESGFGYTSRSLDEGLAQTVEWMADRGLVSRSGSAG